MTAQWMGMERTHANTLVPVLVSNEQGLGKSTFCRSLLPDSPRAYYLDNLNLSPGTSPEKKLVQKGLIDLDEFDKISEKRQPDLKNLLQMVSVLSIVANDWDIDSRQWDSSRSILSMGTITMCFKREVHCN